MIVKAIKEWIYAWLRFAWLWFLYIVSSENSGLQLEYESRAHLHFPEKRVVSGRDVYLQTVLTNSSVKPVPKKEEHKRSRNSSVTTIVEKFEKKPLSEELVQPEIKTNKPKSKSKRKCTTEQDSCSAASKPAPILCKRSEILGHGEDDLLDVAAESCCSSDNTDSLWEELVARYAADETAKECDELKTRLRPRLGSMERTDSVKSEEDIARQLDGKLQKYLSRIDDDFTTGNEADSKATREIDLDLSNIPTICNEDVQDQIFIMIEDDSSDTKCEEKAHSESSELDEPTEFSRLLKSYETELNLTDVSEVGDDIELNYDYSIGASELLDKEIDDSVLPSLDVPLDRLECDGVLVFPEPDVIGHSEDQEVTADLNNEISTSVSQLVDEENTDRELQSLHIRADVAYESDVALSESDAVNQDFDMLCSNLDDEEDRDFEKIIACYIDTTNHDDDDSNVSINEIDNYDAITSTACISKAQEMHDEVSPIIVDLEHVSVNSVETEICNDEKSNDKEPFEPKISVSPICVELVTGSIEFQNNKDTVDMNESNISVKQNNEEVRSSIEQTTVDSQCKIVDNLPEYNLQADGTLCQDTLNQEVETDLEVIECDSHEIDHTFEVQDDSAFLTEDRLQEKCKNGDDILIKQENCTILGTQAIAEPLIVDQVCKQDGETSVREPFNEIHGDMCLNVGEKFDNYDASNTNNDDLSRQIELLLEGISHVEQVSSDNKNAEQRLADIFNIQVSEDNEEEESIPSFNEELNENLNLPDISEEIILPELRCSSPQMLEQNTTYSQNTNFLPDYASDDLLDNTLPEESYRRNSKFSLEDIPEETEVDEDLTSDDDEFVETAAEDGKLPSKRKNNDNDDVPCDGGVAHATSQNDIPEYLDDMKDLLIPRARRKKAKKFKELEEILRVDEPMAIPNLPPDSESLDQQLMEVEDQNLLDEQNSTSQAQSLPEWQPDNDNLVHFTEVEKEELKEIDREQEHIRVSQMRELEKFLSMPCTLTEQEQNELQEILAEEESDKVLSATIEARLMAFLSDVRNRLGYYSDEEENEDFDEYLKLPMSLTKDEEQLLSDDGYEELNRNDFSTDDEYKEYVKNKYLQELETARQKVEEDFDYEHEYDYDYSYDEGELQDAENKDNSYYKDQAVGTDTTSAPKKLKKNKLKNYLAMLSNNSSKSTNKYLADNPSDPLPKDKKDSISSQSKFFRYGSLGKKKKRKNRELNLDDGIDTQNPAGSSQNECDPDIYNEKSHYLTKGGEKSSCQSTQSEGFDQSITESNKEPLNFDNPVSSNVVNTTHEPDLPDCSDRLINPVSDFTPIVIEKVDKTTPIDDVCIQNNVVIFPLRCVENFQLDDIYLARSKGDIWDEDSSYLSGPQRDFWNASYDPVIKIDRVMSTRKDLRRTPGSEVDGIKSPMLDEFEKMEQELEEAEKKNATTNGIDKKRKDGEKKKKKKRKKTEAEKENKKNNIQTRDVIYEKHVGPRIRSFDTAKMKSKFNKPKESTQVSSECHICGKPVFQMEKIVAEKASWHKNCFRCNECNKQLTLESYQSHEGTLYCKPHFKELFRPKAVIQDEDTARKDRLMRRPRMIVLESQPEILSDDIVRATATPDYGLDELQSLNVKQRFSMFENADKVEEAPKLEHISVQRSQSLMSKAARFYEGENTNGVDFDEDDEEDEEMDEENDDVVDGEMNGVVKSRKKKERPMSISGIGDLKTAWEQKQRREEMTQARKDEVGRFRQLLCAGKNNHLKEMFESGKFENEDDEAKQKVTIEVRHASKSLRERFEKGQPFIMEDDEERNGNADVENSFHSERDEVDEIFKEAETAKQARNVFKQIDSIIVKEGAPVMRSKSFAQTPREKRCSQDGMRASDDIEIGRDPNLIKCTDKYEDDVDCKNTKIILQMFRKLEMAKEEETEQDAPRPMKSFTPPPEGENHGEESGDEGDEYSDEDYTDEDEDSEEEKPKYKDEILEMAQSSQSAKKAAHLRAKFERYESEIDRGSSQDQESEGVPSLDTARNLRAMFENKAVEESRPVVRNASSAKVNRFVGGGGEPCVVCEKTVYAMEKLELQGKVLHKYCFKCFKCNTRLSMGSFSLGGNKMFCTTHYKQLFTEKGSYDAFLGERVNWTEKIEAINEDLIRNHD